jgi:hypothetical protein
MVGRLAVRKHALYVLAGIAVAAVVLVPTAAEASCAPLKPRESLAASPAAFIGHVVERQGDRVTFAVDESVKGELGERVVVRDEYPGLTSIGNLGDPSDERVGLFLRRDGDGFSANACFTATPEAMRVAAASRYTKCASVRVTQVTTVRRPGRRLRLRAALAHRDGHITKATVNWGDRTSGHVLIRPAPGAHTVAVELAHRYRRAGRYLVRIIASSRPTLDCAPRGFRDASEMSKPRTRPVRIG